MNKEQKQTDGTITLPREYFIEGVQKAACEVKKKLHDARKKFGAAYNSKNEFDVFDRRFGYDDAEKILREYELVWVKRSRQPAIIRKVIKAIGDSARRHAIRRYVSERHEQDHAENTVHTENTVHADNADMVDGADMSSTQNSQKAQNKEH